MTIDRRGVLAGEPFDVQVTRDKVFVRFRGRLVRTLTGGAAAEIRAAVAAGDPAQVQLLVARRTGNFKRGNDRETRPRNEAAKRGRETRS